MKIKFKKKQEGSGKKRETWFVTDKYKTIKSLKDDLDLKQTITVAILENGFGGSDADVRLCDIDPASLQEYKEPKTENSSYIRVTIDF